jgi:hypothetical protein
VCLKKPSTHLLLHLRSFVFLYKMHHHIPSLSKHVFNYIVSCNDLIFHISSIPLQIFQEIYIFP